MSPDPKLRIDGCGGPTTVRDVAKNDSRDKEISGEDREDQDDAGDAGKNEPGGAEGSPDGSGASADSDAQTSGTDSADDEAAKRVASALGVGEEDEAASAGEGEADKGEEEKPAAAPNRAARRREEALRRKRKRAGGSAAAEEEEEASLAKDRNARAKQLLRKRQEQAAEPRPVALLPSEMVDDALARTWSATTKWLRTNFNVLQWIILAVLVGGGGYLFYVSRIETKSGNASGALIAAVAAERGRVTAEDKRTEDEKQFDPTRVFATAQERSDAAMASYNQVIDQHPGTGPAMLAKLGQAGVFLEKRDYPHAIEAYSAVLASPLANADPDVKGRALEGLGFAKEGSGEIDSALETFKEMGKLDAKGFKELSRYHQARLHLAKGEKEKAKDLLKELLGKTSDAVPDPTKDALSNPSEKTNPLGLDQSSFPYLKTQVEALLTRIDPTAVPKGIDLTSPMGGRLSPEQRKEIERRLQEAAEKAGQHEEP